MGEVGYAVNGLDLLLLTFYTDTRITVSCVISYTHRAIEELTNPNPVEKEGRQMDGAALVGLGWIDSSWRF